jgi:hypothetical protein
MSQTIYFLFSYYFDKTDITFRQGKRNDNLWLLTLFLPLNTEEISSSL